ncbi:ASCH domain-containing protein [Methanocalculus taiwanensis]|nr:ASCH domain-containing protein [Methanocalculus taiwanensis]
MSVKPKYADKILVGSKKFEFRKVIFRHPDVHEIVIYSSSPVKKIVGTCTIRSVVEDDPLALWEHCKEAAGIGEEDFFSYFEGRKRGYAIEIGKTDPLERPVDPKVCDPEFMPPQSFQYVDDAFYSKIKNAA